MNNPFDTSHCLLCKKDIDEVPFPCCYRNGTPNFEKYSRFVCVLIDNYWIYHYRDLLSFNGGKNQIMTIILIADTIKKLRLEYILEMPYDDLDTVREKIKMLLSFS